MEKRREILELCTRHGVLAILTGHRHKKLESQYEGISMVTGETTNRNFDGRARGFRWWDVAADGSLSHRFVAADRHLRMAVRNGKTPTRRSR